MNFYYDGEELIGFNYNGNDYYYGKTNNGEIRFIYDSNGNIVTTYHYDAWGTPISTTGTLASTVGTINPFRYKSYYYDSETRLYYLQSRYYDPQVGRFLNADSTDFLGATQTLLSYNLFAYCENDSVNSDDIIGVFSIKSFLTLIGKILSFTGVNIVYLWNTYLPIKYFSGKIHINSWVISSLVDALIALISRAAAIGLKGFMSAIKGVAKLSKKSFVNFFKQTIVPFFVKNLSTPLKTFMTFIGNLVLKNRYTIINDKISANIDRLLPNTGTIVNYLLSAISSFGTLVSFILDLSDTCLDGYFSVKVR